MSIFAALLRYGSLLAAAAGFFLITRALQAQADSQPKVGSPPPVEPPRKPFAQSVAATGILEAMSENVSIGTPIPGLVTEVFVKVNETVKKDQPLLKMEDRDLRAEELSAAAQRDVAQAQITVSEAQIAKLEAQLSRLSSVQDTRAISSEDLENRKRDVTIARAQLTAAKAQVTSCEAAQARLSLLIDRLTIRAPRAGSILQVNIRAGEYANNAQRTPVLILGDLEKLQVRADVDEQNAIRIRAGQKAYAYLKGDPTVTFPLEFLRIEPYIIPKVSLTGTSTERVDTRVLQVIYSLTKPSEPPIYVGQQVDVFIEAPDKARHP